MVPARGKRIWAPSERPIQLRCMSLMFSSHSKPSRSSRSLSAYAVIRSIHCKATQMSTFAVPSVSTSPKPWLLGTCEQLKNHDRKHDLQPFSSMLRGQSDAVDVASRPMKASRVTALTERWRSIEPSAYNQANTVSCIGDAIGDQQTWSMGIRTTGKPPRSDLPSITSSLASTVPSSGHQLTGTSAW